MLAIVRTSNPHSCCSLATLCQQVLAPLTDSNGVNNWDHGTLGLWHDREAASKGAYGPEEGLLDVTAPPFSADPTGATDATTALQGV